MSDFNILASIGGGGLIKKKQKEVVVMPRFVFLYRMNPILEKFSFIPKLF